MPDPTPLYVAFDTSTDQAGVALSEGERLLAETTWRTRQSHSRQLLPALEWLLERQGRTKHDIAGISVCLGPGTYAGLRVGLSTAKALAYALDVPLTGIGRLECDAWPLASTVEGRVVPLHAAGRAELAWAVYTGADGIVTEAIEPSLAPNDALLAALQPGDLVCADPGSLPEAVVTGIAAGARLVEAPSSRVVALARLGAQRLLAGRIDNPDTLVPLYLRAPAIGPQTPH